MNKLSNIKTLTVNGLKPFTPADKLLAHFLADSETQKMKDDMRLMAMGICPECKNDDPETIDEVHVQGEFPGQGTFMFRCKCGFETSK